MFTQASIVNALVIVTTLGFLVFFDQRWMRRSTVWRAMVTPLASIIGSGFLVVAPLLGFVVGRWAVVAMLVIVILAYLVGSALRYNIAYVEDISEAQGNHDTVDAALKWMGRVAKLALALAYVIAITFYLELLGAFVLHPFAVDSEPLQKTIATGLLIFIGGFGLWRGLRRLEFFETYAVDIKLSIIAGFLVALGFVNVAQLADGQWALPTLDTHWSWDTFRKLLGAFLIVQGFETSRYLRGAYSPELRIATMRYAQWMSAGIYVVFVGLATIFFGLFQTINETGIIDLSANVASTLPLLLIVGAAMSQFSAAVADTIGSGGLTEEVTHGQIPHQWAYAGAAVLAILLLWSANIFVVIAYASRAFAFYYMIQCAMAALHAASATSGGRAPAKAVFFALLALAMLGTAIFGIPAETVGAT
jgi:hypothetical protein